MPERSAYYCGDWIPEQQLAIPVGDFGFAMGVTVTERLRTFGGQVFRKTDHLVRMRRSLEVIGLDANRLINEVSQAIDEFCNRHREQIAPGDDWAMVAFITPGAGTGPTVCVHGFPLPFSEWADQFTLGVATYLSDHRQVPPNCWPAVLKCRSRMHYYLADMQARQKKPRARGILLDQEGFVGEASTANLVTYHEASGLATPKPTKVLPGVSVAVIAELAGSLGVPLAERDITLQEFTAASEVWLTSTSACMLPVVEFDDRLIGGGQPGAMYGKFLKAWSELVGVDIAGQAERFADRHS